MVEAVIFDMDGLLIDSEPFWVRTEVEVFGELGLDLNSQDCSNTAGLRIDEVVKYWHDRLPWEGSSLKEVEDKIVNGVKKLIETEGNLLPGVSESLEFLKSIGMRCALASSSKMELIQTAIASLEIKPFFELVHSAEFEKRGKPHPDTFLSTAKSMNLFPGQCLVLEDSSAGAQAASRAMMPFVAVPNASPASSHAFERAEVILKSLSEFPAWFNSYLSS